MGRRALLNQPAKEFPLSSRCGLPVRLNGGMTSPYGFGWGAYRTNDHLIVSHSGSIRCFRFYIFRAAYGLSLGVDERLTVIVLDNRLGGSTLTSWHYSRRRLRGFISGRGTDYQPIPDREPEITARVRDIHDRCRHGALLAEDFTPEVWAELSPWQMEMQEDGKESDPAFSLALVERTTEAGGRSYRYRVQHKYGTSLVHVVLRHANKR